MIDGPGALHWCTFYDPEDGEPYGETCRCEVGQDHNAADLPATPAPPAPGDAILARQITPADVEEFPDYFITGPGRERAELADCPHGYRLTDSCPTC